MNSRRDILPCLAASAMRSMALFVGVFFILAYTNSPLLLDVHFDDSVVLDDGVTSQIAQSTIQAPTNGYVLALGTVEVFESGDGDPLLFCRGQFGDLARPAE